MEWRFSLDNIHEVAKAFWAAAGDRKVIAFHGGMGSGKTTFIHALCDVKDVKDVVSSPTFPIINEYNYDCDGTKRIIFHIDMYRLRDAEEAMQAGVEECLNSGYCCLVEWPERAPSIFPAGTLHAFIRLVDDKFRLLEIGNN